MSSLPVGVINVMQASGGLAPVGLFEMLSASGNLYTWSEQTLNQVICKALMVEANFAGWIVGQPKFTLTGTTQTDTGSISVQNYSGDTVNRDVATIFSTDELIGALVYYRLWRADAEVALFTFVGNISNVEIDDDQMDLSIEGLGNWSAVTAPAYLIGENCGLFFGSSECASISPTPCQNTYGTCTSIERYKGVILQWVSGAFTIVPTTQIAQPPPVVARNPGRAF